MTLHLSRRAVFAGAGLLIAGAGRAQAWPSRPVRIIVGFTAGSSTDVTARLFAPKLAEAWGQPVVVENIPGNSGAVGADRVAKAAPDGHTLLWGANGALTIVPSMQQLPFDPLKDLAPIGITLSMPTVILVNNDQPIRSMAELVARAKAEPGKLSYGTPGAGTPQHIAAEMLCHLADIRMEHIPYRGANLTDLLNGSVPIGLQNAGAAMPLIRDGRVRCIAVTSLQRSSNLPDMPTMVEQGFPGFEAISWFGTMAPIGTDPVILRRVHADTTRILQDADIRARVAQLGLDPVGGTPEEMHRTIATDIPKWAAVMRNAGLIPSR